MGATMHTHIEVKTKDGRWLHYGAPRVERNRLLFSCICGMFRDDFESAAKIHPVTRIHEMPEDVSEVTAACFTYDSSSYSLHDIGVMEPDDLEKLQKNLYEICGVDLKYDLEHEIFRTYINSGSIAQHAGFEDSRVIFWFDN